MNIIIVGAGKVGFTVAGHLAGEGHDITIVDTNIKALETALEAVDVAGLQGSGTEHSSLIEAGVGNADLLISLTGSDERNLLCCLLAKKLGAKNTIARVRSPQYSTELPYIAEDLGLSLAVNPERETALEIARILEFPIARKVETFAGGRVEMIDYDVSEASPMYGKTVREAFSDLRSGLVCAVERAGEVYIPLGDFRFEKDDVMTIVAPRGRLSAFFREAGMRTANTRRVLISGGGRTSFYLASQLLTQRTGVTIIEQNEATAHELSEALGSAEVVVGDGTDQSLLRAEGLADADAFCALTGIDEENILTSLYARTVNENIKTVTKINRTELMPIVAPIGLGSIVSPKLIAADRVISYVRARDNGVGSGVLTLYRLVSGKAEALEFRVDKGSSLAGVPISELKLKDEVIIASINRAGRIISPRGGDRLMAGDTVIVVTTHAGFNELDDIRR